MAMCGKINVFVANFPGLPSGRDPNSAQFFEPSYTYLSPLFTIDEAALIAALKAKHEHPEASITYVRTALMGKQP